MFKQLLYFAMVLFVVQASASNKDGLPGQSDTAFVEFLRPENEYLSEKDLSAKKTGASIVQAKNLQELKAALEEAKEQKHPIFQSDDCQKLIVVKILSAAAQETQ